jgi:FkbM family methyltransferase
MLPRHFEELVTPHRVGDAPDFWVVTPAKDDDLNYRGIREGWLFDAAVRYVVSRLSSSDTFVDVGANLGTFAIPAALKCRRVLAIEALPVNFVLLCRSLVKNRLTNVTPVHCAAHAGAGIVNVAMESAWATVSDTAPGVSTPALSLDEMFSIHGVSDVAILKIDIEGSELPALRGMERALRARAVREILLEVNETHCRAAGYTGDELLHYLAGHGYLLYQIYDGILSPFSPGEFRGLACNNFLASLHKLSGQHGELVVKEVARETVLGHAMEYASSAHKEFRAHIAEEIRRAPSWLLGHADFIATVRKLENDPEPTVRHAYACGTAAG